MRETRFLLLRACCRMQNYCCCYSRRIPPETLKFRLKTTQCSASIVSKSRSGSPSFELKRKTCYSLLMHFSFQRLSAVFRGRQQGSSKVVYSIKAYVLSLPVQWHYTEIRSIGPRVEHDFKHSDGIHSRRPWTQTVPVESWPFEPTMSWHLLGSNF